VRALEWLIEHVGRTPFGMGTIRLYVEPRIGWYRKLYTTSIGRVDSDVPSKVSYGRFPAKCQAERLND
jgi:hypothetical protein